MKIFFTIIFILILFTLLFAEEIYIKKGNSIYKIIIDNNDTISKEKIKIIELFEDTLIKEQHIVDYEYDKQLLKHSIPYKWQIGMFGLWQGSYYGFAISNGILPDSMNGREQLIAFSSLAMPFIMFLTPPLILKGEIEPIAIPIIDWGYRMGPIDYFALKTLINGNGIFSKYDFLFSALTGYAESWGAYYLLKSLGDFKRAAGHFYNAGAILGYMHGTMQGIYIANKFGNNWNDTLKTRTIAATAIAYSYSLRALGFYMGNNDNYKWHSFDSWIIAINTIPGMLYANEIYVLNKSLNDITMPLSMSLGGIISSCITTYLLRNTHFDDGNALLLMLGGALGSMVGSGINLFFNEYHPAITATGIIMGELAVYFLRKNTIGINHNSINNNLGFMIIPSLTGISGALSFSF